MADHRIFIRQHRPWQRTWVTVLAVAALLLAGFALYRYTRQSTVADFEKATTERPRARDFAGILVALDSRKRQEFRWLADVVGTCGKSRD